MEREVVNVEGRRSLFDAFAMVGRALGHGVRIELLEHLAQAERSVEHLSAAAGLTLNMTSRQLLAMKQTGLVRSRRNGQRVFYRLADDSVIGLLSALQQVAERNLLVARSAINDHCGEQASFEAVSAKDLARLLKRGEVLVLDVRTPEEFAACHIPGAINIPLRELPARLAELRGKPRIVAYCRGAYWSMSLQAARLLSANGYRVSRLARGLPEWKVAGLPISSLVDNGATAVAREPRRRRSPKG